MNETGKSISRRLVFALLLLIPIFAVVARTTGQDGANDSAGSEQWEYLVVASPSGTNFTPSGNSRMRKDSTGTFGREAFVLEQQMDRVGGRGWELVAITGSQSDPIYFFKRRR